MVVKNNADWKCENCGKQCRRPDEPFDTHRNTLTVSHQNHNPQDVRLGNLKALCAPCHLRYDAKHHAETRRGKKYHNSKTIVDGMEFDSKKESARFQELKLLERSGHISDLRMQVRFEIVPKAGGNNRARYYYADFVYCEGGKRIIEDVKSKATATDKVFSLKWALMKWRYPEYEYRIYD